MPRCSTGESWSLPLHRRCAHTAAPTGTRRYNRSPGCTPDRFIGPLGSGSQLLPIFIKCHKDRIFNDLSPGELRRLFQVASGGLEALRHAPGLANGTGEVGAVLTHNLRVNKEPHADGGAQGEYAHRDQQLNSKQPRAGGFNSFRHTYPSLLTNTSAVCVPPSRPVSVRCRSHGSVSPTSSERAGQTASPNSGSCSQPLSHSISISCPS